LGNYSLDLVTFATYGKDMNNHFQYLLVIIDTFSKWVEIFHKEAKTMIIIEKLFETVVDLVFHVR